MVNQDSGLFPKLPPSFAKTPSSNLEYLEKLWFKKPVWIFGETHWNTWLLTTKSFKKTCSASYISPWGWVFVFFFCQVPWSGGWLEISSWCWMSSRSSNRSPVWKEQLRWNTGSKIIYDFPAYIMVQGNHAYLGHLETRVLMYGIQKHGKQSYKYLPFTWIVKDV